MILDPENAKVKIAAPKWILGSRVAELFFATGIPVTGFALAAKNVATLDNFIWFYPVTLLAGWHVLAVNDLFFSATRIFQEEINCFLLHFFFPFSSSRW